MRRLAVLTLCVLLPATARGYDQAVHVLLSEWARPDAKALQPSDDAQAVTALRLRLYRAGAEAPDAEVRRRFLQRYPTAEAFDAWAYKRFLGLNPDKQLAGLDPEVALPPGDARAAYGLASRLPDDDWRNRERFRHDEKRQVLHAPDGTPLPEDPATLEMGGLTGLSSQAHAHYQLADDVALSDDPAVLKSDPRRFAVPPSVHTFGAEYADVYTVLALLARRLPAPSERLVLTHAGAAAHHLEDVANQIHAVQVGIYDFFVAAKLEQLKEELRSVGGLVRARPGFVSIGIDIISNHHTLAESLYQKHLLAAGDAVRARTEAMPPDAAFEAELAKVPATCTVGFAGDLTRLLARRSSHEGPEVYAAIHQAALPRYSRVGVHFEPERDDPDRALRPGVSLDHFYDLEARGARRAEQVLAAWWQRFEACAQADAAGGNDSEARAAAWLIRDRLDALEAADRRARAYVPKPPETVQLAGWVPALYAALLGLGAFVAYRLARRRRAR